MQVDRQDRKGINLAWVGGFLVLSLCCAAFSLWFWFSIQIPVNDVPVPDSVTRDLKPSASSIDDDDRSRLVYVPMELDEMGAFYRRELPLAGYTIIHEESGSSGGRSPRSYICMAIEKGRIRASVRMVDYDDEDISVISIATEGAMSC
jgi:hypothetical protein